jgi:outer membrane protein OmpA-like peptidoglycan-associated protein
MILMPVQEKAEIVLNNVFFNFDSYALLPKSKSELDRMVDVMKDNPSIDVSIIGHTDNIGTEEYNLGLSKKRAKSVVDYLVANGISVERLSFEGKGELYPEVPNTSKENRAQNRRVNFKVD